MCHFDDHIKLILLDNDCVFHSIFDVIYRKPCSIHIKSVQKVMNTTFSEISLVLESLSQFFSSPAPTFPEIYMFPPASIRLQVSIVPPSRFTAPPPPPLLIIGSLSRHVFEQRTLTGSLCFCF